VVNSGHAEAWSCLLTRRLVLALLERAPPFLASSSPLAKRATTDVRSELAAFERDAALAKTTPAMSKTPFQALKPLASAASLAERLTFAQQGAGFRMEVRGADGGGADGRITREDFQRILQMLRDDVAKAGWTVAPAASEPAAATPESGPKPFRH
jgi:hypothetical protein